MAVQWNGPLEINTPPHKKGSPIGIGIATPDNTVLLIGVGYIENQSELITLIDDFLEYQQEIEINENPRRFFS